MQVFTKKTYKILDEAFFEMRLTGGKSANEARNSSLAVPKVNILDESNRIGTNYN